MTMHLQQRSGIYKITNTITNQYYIGSSMNMHRRWREHKSALNRNKHHAPYLQRSWNEHGKDAFQFSIILYCSEESLLFFEQRALDILKPSYNGQKLAGFNPRKPWSDEAKANKPKKVFSIEHRQKLSQALVGNTRTKGKKASDETRVKLSFAKLGNTNSKGKSPSLKTRAKLSAALKDKRQSPEHTKAVKEAKAKKKLQKQLINILQKELLLKQNV